MKEKVKVVVCGVNFGQFYLQACKKSNSIELTGILSQGSQRSQAAAKRLGVPLFTHAEEIPPQQADFAIVAARSAITGGKSAPTVKALLRQGISVAQEQPVHEKEAAELSKQLVKEEQIYTVNNFYHFLPAVEAFLKTAQKISRTHPILRLRLSCSSQVLYPLIDILYDTLEEISSIEVTKIQDGNCSILAGKLNAIPFTLHYYNEYAADIDGSLALFFDLQLDTPAGNLILNDPEGQVIWQTHLLYNRAADFSAEEYQTVAPLQILFDGRAKSYAQRYREIWPLAMARSILACRQNTHSKETAQKTVQKTLQQCALCAKITNAAGRPKKIEIPYQSGYVFS